MTEIGEMIMPFYEREEEILRLLNDGEVKSNGELAKKLFISQQTLRRDLEKLEKKGLIIRTHGGALPLRRPADRHIPFFLREHEHSEAKNAIAKMALQYIHDGDTVMLDGTTSACALVPYLSEFKDITVISSSAKACFLLGNMNIKTICTGGQMLMRSLSYVGDDAIRTLENYNADVVFFSCRGLSDDGLLTDPSIEENLIRRAMMKQSRLKIFLCDSTKPGKKYQHNLCRADQMMQSFARRSFRILKDMGVNSNNKGLSKDSSFGFKTVICRSVSYTPARCAAPSEFDFANDLWSFRFAQGDTLMFIGANC